MSNSFLTSWIKSISELHVIESKPITRARVEMHSLDDLRRWFEDEYIVTLKYIGIDVLESNEAAKRLHSMDEKGARLAYSGGQKIVVLVRINDMYVAIPEN